MNFLILQASPHKNGNTAAMINHFTGSLPTGVFIKRVDLDDMNIKPCRGCFACSGTGKCVIDDDMQTVYPEFASADVILFSTPIFWWGMSAQMKLLIDRMTAFLGPDDSIPVLHGKRLILFITYKFRPTAEATINMFRDFIEWAKISLDIVEYCSLETHVKNCGPKLDEISTLAGKF